MKTYLTLSAIALAAAATLSSGVVTAAEPTPDFTVTGNFGVTSDYRFRGISQNNYDAAFQGGFDVAHSSGLYLGTWGSNVSDWTAANGSLEMDIYGGYKTALGDVALDLGVIAYRYPSSDKSYGANTQEAYLGLAYGPVSFKTSYTLSKHYFATMGTAGYAGSARGTLYYDLSVAQEVLPKLTVSAHAGYTDFKGDDEYNLAGTGKLSYSDYNIGAAYDLNGYVIGVKYFWNDTKPGTEYYAGAAASSGFQGLYKDGVAVSLTKAF
jgi:uncharacterized protein (TIGR02001 family)